MRAFRLTLLLFFLLLQAFGADSALALDPGKLITQYDIRNYTAKDGLPMNTVKKVFQDSRGYIWVGTQEGLARFDGVRFRIYDKSTSPGLRSSFIRDIAEDHAGHLWVATYGGGISRLEGDDFVTYGVAEGLNHDVVNTLLVARDGSLVIGTENGISRFADGRLTPFRLTDNVDANNIQALIQDSTGALYVGRYAVPLTRIAWTDFNADSGSPRHVVTYCRVPLAARRSGFFPCDSPFTALCTTRAGDLLAGNTNGNVGRVAPAAGGALAPFWSPDSPRDQITVRALLEDRDGLVWICTEGRGIVRWHQGESSRLDLEQGLATSGDTFLTIMEDREGSIWIGGDGLLRIRDNTFTCWGRPEKLPGDYGHSVCADPAGTVCAGFKSGGVALIRDHKFDTIYPCRNLLPNHLTVVLPAREGGFWVGYTNGTVFRITSSSEPIQYTSRTFWGNFALRVLLEDSRGRLWRGMSGLLSCREEGGWWDHWFDRLMRQNSEITAMIELAEDDFLFGTYGDGLRRLTRGRFHQEGIPPELQRDGITLLWRDQHRVLWIGSDNHGLYRFADGRYASYTEEDGLFAGRIFAILEDDSSNFWCSSNKGVFRVAKSALADFSAGRIAKIPCRVYSQLDGMREAECSGRRQPAGWKSPDGRLWFTSLAGFVSVDPNHLPHNPVPPPVYIESLRTGDSLYACGAGALRLAARERDLHISYTGLSFAIPERVHFRTRLEGYDKEWRDAGDRREVSYTNLPHGSFTFRVSACNNDGVWNEAGAAQLFVIPPFWYETWWAWLVYVSLAAGALAWIAQRYYRRLFLRQQLSLQREHTARLEELNEAKSRFFAGISHEFRTPLTLIEAPLEELAGQKGDGKSALYAMMLRNTRRLQGLVEQLLDLARMQSGKMTLQAQPVAVFPLLKMIVASFESLARRKRIKLSLELLPDLTPADPPLTLWLDEEKIEKVLVNLLDNALKYTPGGGKVTVILEGPVQWEKRRCLRISVADSGPGIPEEALPHLFDYFYRYRDENRNSGQGTGIGLALSREIIRLHRGEIEVESSPGRGSCFSVLLPLGREHLRPEEIAAEKLLSEFAPLPAIAEAAFNGEPDLPLPEAEPETPDSRKTLLIVEDNADMRDLLRRLLGSDYRLREAREGNEGLRMALRTPPDLILSDVMMPGMDGYELLRALGADSRTSHIPVLLLTARGGGEERITGLQHGAADYLTKPFDRRELHLRIRNLLDLQERVRESLRQRLTALGSAWPGEAVIAPADEKFMQRAVVLIQEHGGESAFAAQALAQRLGVSRAHLNRKLVALTGMKTSHFIRAIRLQRAAEMLRQRAGSVSEIAYAVGFNHLSYFAACFREQYGCSPSEYNEKQPVKS